MAKRPGYVTAQLLDNEAASFNAGTWFIGHKSSRVNPDTKAVDYCFVSHAIATPYGRVNMEDASQVSYSDADTVFEYGFSVAMKQLCPSKWRGHYAGEGEKMFLAVVELESSSSYLLRNREITFTVNHDVLRARDKFWSHFPEGARDELSALRAITVSITSDGCRAKRPTAREAQILEKYGVYLDKEWILR